MAQVIRVEIDEVSQFSDDNERKELKKPIDIDNLHWKFGAFSETSPRTAGVRQLGVVLYCNKENRSNLWSVSATIQLKLVKLGTQFGTMSPEFKFEFSAAENKFEMPNFMNWEEATCPENGYVVDDSAVVEVHVRIGKVHGIFWKPNFEEAFLTQNENLTDLELVFENKSLFVGSQMLRLHCKFFTDRQPDGPMVIDNVSYSEFVEFLHFIYPSQKSIDVKIISNVLKLTKRFDASFVLEKCESFLIATPDFHLVDKLKFSEMYKLSRLQDHCLKQLKTSDDVLELTKHENYKDIGDLTNRVLFRKVLSFTPSSESVA